MEILISQSEVPLVFDAIPAIKVSHYVSQGLSIYTYARVYALKNDIILNLCSFERDPIEESAIQFYFYQKGETAQMVVTLTPTKLFCEIEQDNGNKEKIELEQPTRFSGTDEQGWYWGGNVTVPQIILRKIGIEVEVGKSFTGAVVKRWLPLQNEKVEIGAIGCSAPLTMKNEITRNNFDNFMLVKY